MVFLILFLAFVFDKINFSICMQDVQVKVNILDTQLSNLPLSPAKVKEIIPVLSNRGNGLNDISSESSCVANNSAQPIVPTCQAYLNQFSCSASQFVECAVKYARPFRVCVSCVKLYKISTFLYKDILQNDETKDGCKSYVLKADRMEVVQEIENFIENLWKTSYCSECFKEVSSDSNGTVSYELRASTLSFLSIYSNLTKCLNSSQMQQPLQHNKTKCDLCQLQYNTLNTFFKDLRIKEHHQVCMDLVDMMNTTRQTWAWELNCTKTQPDHVKVIVMAVVFCFIPALYYLMAKFFVGRQKLKIMIQKRLSKAAVRTLKVYGATDVSSNQPLVNTLESNHSGD